MTRVREVTGNLDSLVTSQSCVFISAGTFSCAVTFTGPELHGRLLKSSWRVALPSLLAFLGGNRNFWLHFPCLEGGTWCIVWASAASCILHTKIKSLQMFGLSFAPETKSFGQRRVWNSRVVLRSCFFFFMYIPTTGMNAHQVTEF